MRGNGRDGKRAPESDGERTKEYRNAKRIIYYEENDELYCKVMTIKVDLDLLLEPETRAEQKLVVFVY